MSCRDPASPKFDDGCLSVRRTYRFFIDHRKTVITGLNMTDKSAGQALAVRRRSVSYLFKGVFGFGVLCVSVVAIFGITCLVLDRWHESARKATPITETTPGPSEKVVSKSPAPVLAQNNASPESVSPTPVETAPTPVSTASPLPSAVVTGPIASPSPTPIEEIDAALIGRWKTNGPLGQPDGTIIWVINPSGDYTVSSCAEKKTGKLTASNGKMKQYFDSTNLTLELLYNVNDGTLVTTTPDGKETTWNRTAPPIVSATPRYRPERPERATGSIGNRIFRFFVH